MSWVYCSVLTVCEVWDEDSGQMGGVFEFGFPGIVIVA